jgi:hypothetical protein
MNLLHSDSRLEPDMADGRSISSHRAIDSPHVELKLLIAALALLVLGLCVACLG